MQYAVVTFLSYLSSSLFLSSYLRGARISSVQSLGVFPNSSRATREKDRKKATTPYRTSSLAFALFHLGTLALAASAGPLETKKAKTKSGQ